MYVIAPVLNGKGIRAHGRKITADGTFNGFDGCEDTHQGHQADSDNQRSKNRAKQLASYGLKSHFNVF
jgi:hypothetical protein